MTSSPHWGSDEDPRLRTLVEWERETRDRRPSIRDEVRESAFDKALDAILGDNTLGCDSKGRPSAAVTRGLANKCLTWKIADDLRGRLMPDGGARHTPRAAQSLNAPLRKASSDQPATLGEVVPSTAPDVVETVHWRLQVQELHRRLATAGALTRAAVVTYEIGEDPKQVAAHFNRKCNAIHQATSRFRRDNEDLAQ